MSRFGEGRCGCHYGDAWTCPAVMLALSVNPNEHICTYFHYMKLMMCYAAQWVFMMRQLA